MGTYCLFFQNPLSRWEKVATFCADSRLCNPRADTMRSRLSFFHLVVEYPLDCRKRERVFDIKPSLSTALNRNTRKWQSVQNVIKTKRKR